MRGFDAGKKINGRKRHLLTDTLGLLLGVLVTPASTTDRDAARSLLSSAKNHFRRLTCVWADGGYTGHLTDWATQYLGIVRRNDDVQGVQVLLRRWVVERSPTTSRPATDRDLRDNRDLMPDQQKLHTRFGKRTAS
ncbi:MULTISPECIES: transposase [Streptomyces]